MSNLYRAIKDGWASSPTWLRFLTAINVLMFPANLLLLRIGPSAWLNFLVALQGWQVLIAAMIALVAAIIAYKGAMAKVDLNEKLADRDLWHKKMSQYLRLQFALDAFGRTLKSTEDLCEPRLYGSKSKLSASQLAIVEPAELKEAWDSLELFPMPVIQQIRTIRETLANWNGLLKRYRLSDEPAWEVSFAAISEPPYKIREFAKATRTACEIAAHQLSDMTKDIGAKAG
jgi:hypothetical protein